MRLRSNSEIAPFIIFARKGWTWHWPTQFECLQWSQVRRTMGMHTMIALRYQPYLRTVTVDVVVVVVVVILVSTVVVVFVIFDVVVVTRALERNISAMFFDVIFSFTFPFLFFFLLRSIQRPNLFGRMSMDWSFSIIVFVFRPFLQYFVFPTFWFDSLNWRGLCLSGHNRGLPQDNLLRTHFS